MGSKKAAAIEMLNGVLTEFGVIDRAKDSDAVYVLRSGKIVDAKGHNARASHDNVARWIEKEYGVKDLDEYNGSRFMREACNAIRITPWFNGVFLPEAKMTDKQCSVLVDTIKSFRVTAGKPLLISTADGKQQTEFFDKKIRAEDIVAMCQQYYSDGKLLTEAKKLAESSNLLRYMSTAPGKGACFITPLGMFVRGKGLDHMELLKAIGYSGVEDAIVREKKWIRCDSGISAGWSNAPAPFASLPKDEITEKQYASLLEWLSTCVSGDCVEIFFEAGDYATYDLDERPADDIIKIIRYYYRQGILREDLKDKAKQCFGVVPEWQSDVGFYINTDGTILDGSGESYGNVGGRDSGRRACDHREISDIFGDGESGNDAMLQYMHEGNIRWMPESPGIEMMIEPTDAQYRTIARLVSRNARKGFYVDFVDMMGNNIGEKDFELPRAASVISAIRDNFESKDIIESSKKRIERLLGIGYKEALAELAQKINERLDEAGFDLLITGLDFTGSRRFGEPKEDSDLDVRMTYEPRSGRCREDDVFNCLNDESNPLWLNGYRLDINPSEGEDVRELVQADSGFRKQRESLTEDTRGALIAKSRSAGPYKDQSRGKNRFERKKWSKVANAVRLYNQIDMNDFFKKDVLLVKIPVTGETDDYIVSIKMEGVCAEIAKSVKNAKGRFEYKNVAQALTKVFNTGNVYVNCSCDDFTYNFSHWTIVNGVSTEDTAHDPGPGKNIRNPHDDKGSGCKHVLLALSNMDWLMKVASVINNYVHYAEKNMSKAFLKLIFPKIYGIPADEMVEQGLIDDEKYLDSSPGLIDAINEYGRNRGKYAKGTNKNPVTGTGGRVKKPTEAQQDEKEEAK